MNIPGFNAHASLYVTRAHYGPAGAVMQVQGTVKPDFIIMAQQPSQQCCTDFFSRCNADPNCVQQVNAIRNDCANKWALCHALDYCDSCTLQYHDPCHVAFVCDGLAFDTCPNFWAYNDWSCVCNEAC